MSVSVGVGGTSVLVGVAVPVGVGLAVGVAVGVAVADAVGVALDVTVGDAVGLGVGVGVTVGTAVDVAVSVGVTVGTAVDVAVSVGVGGTVELAVGEAEGVGVSVIPPNLALIRLATGLPAGQVRSAKPVAVNSATARANTASLPEYLRKKVTRRLPIHTPTEHHYASGTRLFRQTETEA